MQHQRLGAIENIDGAVAARGAGDVGEIVARLPFGMREREAKFAGRDAAEICCRSAPLPPGLISPPPSTTVARYGSSTSARPICSITIMVSTGPPADPPCFSAKGRPRRPSSAYCFHAIAAPAARLLA